MSKLIKIFSEENYIHDQFLVLADTQELLKKDERDKTDLKRLYNSVFLSILYMGYPAKIINDSLEIVSPDNNKFFANLKELSEHNDRTSDLIVGIINGTWNFFYQTEAEKEKEKQTAEAAVKQTTVEDIAVTESASTEEEVRDIDAESVTDSDTSNNMELEDIEEEVTTEIQTEETDKNQEVTENTDESKSDTTQVNESNTEKSVKNLISGIKIKTREENKEYGYAFGYLDEPEELAETNEYKYLETMWFKKNHVIVENANSQLNGANRKEFDFILYPVTFPKENETRLPIKNITILYSCEDERYKIALEDQNIITYEDYEFMTALKINQDAELEAQINLTSKDKYVIAVNDDTIATQKGKFVPKNFGKKIVLGEDVITLYPLYTTNNEKKGTVTCAVIHSHPSFEEPEMRVEKGDFLIAVGDGSKNIMFAPYWNDNLLMVDIG